MVEIPLLIMLIRLMSLRAQALREIHMKKRYLKKQYLARTPVLGVIEVTNNKCFYNGKLEKIKGHAGTRHSIKLENSKYTNNVPSEVNSFHNYGVPEKSWKRTCTTCS